MGLWRSWLARLYGIQEVRGSNPLRSTFYKFRTNKTILTTKIVLNFLIIFLAISPQLGELRISQNSYNHTYLSAISFTLKKSIPNVLNEGKHLKKNNSVLYLLQPFDAFIYIHT